MMDYINIDLPLYHKLLDHQLFYILFLDEYIYHLLIDIELEKKPNVSEENNEISQLIIPHFVYSSSGR